MSWNRLHRSRRFRGTLRVLAFLATANLAFTALTLPQARAAAEEAAKQSGLELLKQIGPTLVGPPQVALLNGQRMSLASKLTPLSVAQVIERFGQHCREHSAGLAGEIAALPSGAAALQRLPEELRDPSRWLSSETSGSSGKVAQIACIARKGSGGGLQGLVERIAAFTESGDLSEIGDARYVVARRDDESGQTHVLAMWTEGKFNIPEMFSDRGDAPGSDSSCVPRPPEARRVLTAEMAHRSYAIRMYDTARANNEVLSYYEQQLTPRGFLVHPLPHASAELDLNDHVRAFSKDGVAVIVVTSQTPAEKTGVSIIELGSMGFSKASASAIPEGILE
ncbi:MAG TPA: hypothetical protein VGC79_30215 [Polyangiaceae bacterium]